MRLKTWHGIVTLSALALLSWQIARRPLQVADAPPGLPDIRLNYALYDFSGRLLDDQGRVKINIASPVLKNDAQSGIGTIDAPKIHIQQEHDRWYITAESASVSPDREVVVLEGAVNLTRRNELTDQTLEIKTSEVVLNVTPRIAATDASVTIRQHGDRLDAVGMKLDMVNRHYELLNDVKGHYETP